MASGAPRAAVAGAEAAVTGAAAAVSGTPAEAGNFGRRVPLRGLELLMRNASRKTRGLHAPTKGPGHEDFAFRCARYSLTCPINCSGVANP